MKRLLIFPLLMVLALTSCKDPYGAAAKAGADIGTGIAEGMKTVDGLRVQGVITSAEESKVLDYLEFANTGDRAYLLCVATAHTSGSKPGTFTACATAFNSALNNPTELALIRVSNMSAANKITTIVNGIATGVTAVVAALGGA